ncbi:MAG: hypothetical protein JWM12_1420 [Ilumatobacteraceae bacterium]|nr:hypothetical protein [Ilumatobacteraceae bacterium]
MAWDSSRPVPWQRLMREAAIFLVLGVIIFAVAIKHSTPSSYVGLVVGMFLFVGVSAVLAKFGYSRQSMKELRAAQAARPRSSGRSRAGRSSTPNTAAAVARTKPAPTKRTSTGPSQRPNRKRR